MVVFATHVGRLISAVVINPCGLEGQELGVFVARCTAGLIDVVLEVLHEDTLAGAHIHKRMLPGRHTETNLENDLEEEVWDSYKYIP